MADTDRIDRFTAFTKLPRAVAQDGRISYRARGLLAALWCDRPGWTWTIEHLARTRGPAVEGHTAITRAVKELREAGYVHRTAVPVRGEQMRTAWTLHRAALPGGAAAMTPWLRWSHAVGRDGRISYRARGLLADQLSYARLDAESVALVGGVATLDDRHRIRGEGRAALRTALAELLAAGYATQVRGHDAAGRLLWQTALYRLPVPVPALA
ncbi:hypothetical protein ACFV0L_41475 [Streptosporangium canum]|uniref:hypothetical protein n=1 Tax=Streptosporangium canum TaxID=324952 RepID=UPI0036AC97FA